VKILHLLDERWDSGLTAFALQTAVVQKRKGAEVMMGVLPGQKPEKMAQQLGLSTHPIAGFFQLAKFLSRSSWDVVNTHTGRTHTWAVLALKSPWVQGRPALVRTRGDARSLNAHALSRFVYSQTHGVIACSEHIRRQYAVRFGFSEEKARTIYPAVHSASVVQPPREKTIGILGRFDPVKGHATFFEAAVRVLEKDPQALFFFFFSKANLTQKMLCQHVNSLGIGKAVSFYGYVPSREAFMQECSVGVIASIGSEEVSRACLEWMAVGRPVVGTMVGSLPELIDVGETGLLVPPGNAVALSEALLEILGRRDMARRLGENAHRTARLKFNDEVLYEKTMLLYVYALSQLETKK